MRSDDQMFVGLTPLIQVFDMPAALAFYRDILGFRIVAASQEVETPEGRFSHWVWLRLGAIDLMLNTQYDSGERPQAPVAARSSAHEDTCFFIGCTDIDAIHKQLNKLGLKVDPPSLAPYGLKRFNLHDPDGYLITFQEHRQNA